jgi:ATP-dependent 26S proteasome regulatory subunit
MSNDKEYQDFEEKRANIASTSRILELLRATEPGIIIETPELAETVSEITRLAATSEARNIAPRWLGERPEVVRVTFSNYPQELRVIKPSVTTLSNGKTVVTFTEPIEGDGDFNPMHGDAKVMPYGDPIDCEDTILEPIPNSVARKTLGASQRVKFPARANAEHISMTFLQSLENFDSQKHGRGRIYVLEGADNFLGWKTMVEMLREKIDYFRTQHVTGLAIILLVPLGFDKMPDALKESFFSMKWERPHKTHWRNQIRKFAQAKKMHMDEDKDGNPIEGLSDKNLERCVSAVTGMTKARGEAALLMCAAKYNKILPETILREKASLVKDYGLTLHNPDPDEVVGGMQEFHSYVEEEVACATPKAIGYGLRNNRMVIFGGPPGTGKSLAVKVLGSQTGRPIIRLAATDLRKKYVGEGEARLKIAVDLAASMEGIVWIDEVEKLVQNTSAERDGGSSASVLSILLTEIQENKSNIMFAFTANRVEMLPPEFIDRAGSRFYFAHPTRDEQLAILRIHIAAMRKFSPNSPGTDAKGFVRRNPDDYSFLEDLLKYSDGCNGRQIANAVQAAFKIAFTRHQGEPELEDFVKGINRNSMNATPEKELELIRDNCLARGFIPANTETEEEAEVIDFGDVGISGRF